MKKEAEYRSSGVARGDKTTEHTEHTEEDFELNRKGRQERKGEGKPQSTPSTQRKILS